MKIKFKMLTKQKKFGATYSRRGTRAAGKHYDRPWHNLIWV